ncbi:hypothetical protein BXZ70DRAFT_291336 [Cristinia sonorae]|uniref:Uncharacterized protein n=1 Tax=Cristinia sonorae TaxID=1940300 RepID=A0A8K0XNV4_9AGAR|nr:hypothetical protein BXZ70DRAFT_291336 [Cristinia sonorae]
MPPEYHLESFWTTRFESEEHFEWLGDGQATILPIVGRFLRQSKNSDAGLPRTLHIGAGTSTLSDQILDVYRSVYEVLVDTDAIVNVDFSQRAVMQGRRNAPTDGTVRWETVDLLDWKDVVGKLQPSREGTKAEGEVFTIVIDKSTSDAISCAPDIHLDVQNLSYADPETSCLTLAGCLATASEQTIEPLELLALHLAQLVRPGGVWIALSYSSNRFPFLVGGGSSLASAFWRIKEVIPVDAPSGQAREGVHAPAVQHVVYVVERY